MGLRGPKPMSPEEKERRGTLEKSRVVTKKVRRSAAKVAAESPSLPEWLDEEGRRVWFRVVPRLDALGMLTKLDGDQLGNYCMEQSTAIRAERDMRGQPLMVETDKGPVPNPLIKIAREARARAQSLAKEFGLTPAARERLATPNAEETPKEEDPLAEFDTSPDATQSAAKA